MKGIKDKIIDYEQNKEEIEKWLYVKGEEKYNEYFIILEKYNIKTTWESLSQLYRYDKRLIFNLFKYFSMFEEYLRAIILRHNKQTDYEVLNRQLFSVIIKRNKDVLEKYFNYEQLEQLIELRNAVAHTIIIVDNDLLTGKISLLKNLLPQAYKENFSNNINESVKGLEISDNLSIKI
ncbi:MAG: hypothetical protein LBN07_04785 [Christensenellaceae bacterium]|jgi:hypothetical protein|nr:hypothetical protein [Christensenellaceae bacterium]